MPIKQPDPIYQGDRYPLDGCTIVIEIRALDYQVAMYQPGAQRANHHLSRLVLSDSGDVAEHVRHLLEKADQASDKGSKVTLYSSANSN